MTAAIPLHIKEVLRWACSLQQQQSTFILHDSYLHWSKTGQITKVLSPHRSTAQTLTSRTVEATCVLRMWCQCKNTANSTSIPILLHSWAVCTSLESQCLHSPYWQCSQWRHAHCHRISACHTNGLFTNSSRHPAKLSSADKENFLPGIPQSDATPSVNGRSHSCTRRETTILIPFLCQWHVGCSVNYLK